MRKGGVVLSHLNPPELERFLQHSGARILAACYHIGYWAWELPNPPIAWKNVFRYVDEIWAPSTFTADALRLLAPAGFPICVVPHPVLAGVDAQPDYERFSLPTDRCHILVAFDLKSTIARKNPYGALEAYFKVFPSSSDTATLVLKVSGKAAAPEIFRELYARCSLRPDIYVIDDALTDREMATLTASSDVILSLHRAEGFGLLLAEGMRLGKAVVATGWSGNMDFMDADTSALVEFTLVPVVDSQGMYSGGYWAEPNVDHAASILRWLINNPEERKALGGRARTRIETQFSPEVWAKVVCDRLFPNDTLDVAAPR